MIEVIEHSREEGHQRYSKMMTRKMMGIIIPFVGLLATLSSPLSAQEYGENPKLPPVPYVDGPLKIELIYPEQIGYRPGVPKNFVFGSVGTAEATLTINGDTVKVAPNGAFLGFIPVPKKSYTLIASKGDEVDTLVYTFSTWESSGPTKQKVHDLFERTFQGIVTSGVEVLASGSDIAYGAPTKTADRQWFFPVGARFPVYERDGDHFRIDIGGQDAWVEAEYVTVTSDAPRTSEISLGIELDEEKKYVDMKIPVDHAPFRIDPQEKMITLTFYNAVAFELEKQLEEGSADSGRYSVNNLPGKMLADYTWTADPNHPIVTLQIDLRKYLWGFKAWYNQAGDLVLRVRKPKDDYDPEQPLDDLKILVDAGHPPRGATGPTGLTEAEANLSIAKALKEALEDRGAKVKMTRKDERPFLTDTNANMELAARVAYAVDEDVDLLISVHNNGFSDGVNPWEKNGTETYYYFAFASELARYLHEEIVDVTGVPSLGYKQRSLVMTRPTWMPSVLTESLYMMFPQQEVALRDPDFIKRLAEAHVRGIESFVRSRHDSLGE